MGFDFKSAIEKMSDTRYARVRHILVDEKGEEGRARLEEVKAEIDGDLDKFSEMAERMSTCTSAVGRRTNCNQPDTHILLGISKNNRYIGNN